MDKQLAQLENKVHCEIKGLEGWLRVAGLTLAVEKTGAVFLNNRRRPAGYSLPFLDGELFPQMSVKYLGLPFDSKKNFISHIETATNKAARIMGALSRLMSTISPLGMARRKMYYRVLESIILYAAPVWADVSEDYRNEAWPRTQQLGLCQVTSYRHLIYLYVSWGKNEDERISGREEKD